ncbi:MAG TPA: cell division protein FtsL [Acidobacteriaceae bacterium]|jgi:cell division protein FtsL|nr:cell division protein FtsL [Acidobacteriaceae bacterium]
MATQAIATPLIGGLGRDTESVAEHNAILLAAQRRGRRGPTPEALFIKRIDNSRLVKANDPARGREMRSFAYAMAFLLSLVMVYGWQHFSAIECGYRISAEKQQMQQLEEQNRQLRLTEAQLANPARIDTMAKNLGLTAPQPGQVVHPNATMDTTGGPVVAESHPAVPAMH